VTGRGTFPDKGDRGRSDASGLYRARSWVCVRASIGIMPGTVEAGIRGRAPASPSESVAAELLPIACPFAFAFTESAWVPFTYTALPFTLCPRLWPLWRGELELEAEEEAEPEAYADPDPDAAAAPFTCALDPARSIGVIVDMGATSAARAMGDVGAERLRLRLMGGAIGGARGRGEGDCCDGDSNSDWALAWAWAWACSCSWDCTAAAEATAAARVSSCSCWLSAAFALTFALGTRCCALCGELVLLPVPLPGLPELAPLSTPCPFTSTPGADMSGGEVGRDEDGEGEGCLCGEHDDDHVCVR
jgi:hypothetical protein